MPRVDIREVAAIAVGGAAGGILRTVLSRELAAAPGDWPWVTLAINVAGAFLLGYFATRLQERLPLSAYRRPLLGTGFCGALTTFSTVQVELLHMIDARRLGLAAAYAAVSVTAGLAAVYLATALVRRTRILA